MRFANLAPFVQMRKVARRRGSTGIGARLHDSCVEGAGAAAQGIERECGGHIGRVHENVGFPQREAQKRQHSLRAVQQRKSFFRLQLDRGDAGALHGFAARQGFVAKPRLPLANHHVRQMRQGCEVAGGADRALRRNYRVHFPVQHPAQRFDDTRPHA